VFGRYNELGLENAGKSLSDAARNAQFHLATSNDPAIHSLPQEGPSLVAIELIEVLTPQFFKFDHAGKAVVSVVQGPILFLPTPAITFRFSIFCLHT
jgi:hypothetical protein